MEIAKIKKHLMCRHCLQIFTTLEMGFCPECRHGKCKMCGAKTLREKLNMNGHCRACD